MGEAKRRKKLDPSYGRPKTPLDKGMVSNLLEGKSLVLCSRIEDESGHGSDFFIENKISEIIESNKQSNIKLAYEIATHIKTIKLGIRRQHEQGQGFLNLMDAEYRKLIGSWIPSDGNSIIFDWYTIAEMKNFLCSSALSKILFALTKSCNTRHQFPCLFSGIPLEEDTAKRFHLLLMVNDSNVFPSEMNVFVARENFN